MKENNSNGHVSFSSENEFEAKILMSPSFILAFMKLYPHSIITLLGDASGAYFQIDNQMKEEDVERINKLVKYIGSRPFGVRNHHIPSS